MDSDAEARHFYRSVLEPVAEWILEAEDGAEALGKALCERPTLVVADTQLPRIDGVSLCQLLRSEPSTRDARTILIAADTGRPEHHPEESGADAVLVKPCAPDEILRTLRGVLEADAQAPPARRNARRTEATRRPTLSGTHERGVTMNPPKVPPTLFCPRCGRALEYVNSHVGGVNAKFDEQWDYLSCRRCGSYSYRHRTRRLSTAQDID